jgi:hypothetical protein
MTPLEHNNKQDLFYSHFFITTALTFAVLWKWHYLRLQILFTYIYSLSFTLKLFLFTHFWESRSFHTPHSSQFTIICTSSSPPFLSLSTRRYIHSFNFLHYSASTATLLASHTYWKLRTWLFLLPQNWLAKYLQVLHYLLQYLLTVLLRGLRHTSWSILSTFFWVGLCRHKRGVSLISHVCSLHFVLCKFFYVYIYIFSWILHPLTFYIISLTHRLAPLLQTTVALQRKPACINVVFSNIYHATNMAPMSKAPPSTARPLTLWRLKYV